MAFVVPTYVGSLFPAYAFGATPSESLGNMFPYLEKDDCHAYEFMIDLFRQLDPKERIRNRSALRLEPALKPFPTLLASEELGMIMPSLWLLWGKTPRKSENGPDTYHPLLCHLIDVAVVAETIWRSVLGPSLRRSVHQTLQTEDEASAGRWMAFCAGSHDIGKVSPPFASQWRPAREWLSNSGYDFPAFPKNVPHNLVTAACLPALFRELGFEAESSSTLARALGGHHGAFPQGDEFSHLGRSALGGPEWSKARSALFRTFLAAQHLTNKPAPHGSLAEAPWLLALLAGLTSVADWIASDDEFFPHATLGVDLDEYRRRAETQAQRALRRLAWLPDHDQVTGPPDFHELFPFDPNPLQQLAITLAGQLDTPAMVLVENPMGGGKTEAALFLADYWQRAQGLRGLYIGLPTQATSNQMFTRVLKFLSKRYPEERVSIQLLHGHASLSAEFQALTENALSLINPQDVAGHPAYDGTPPNLVAAEWFTHRKRGLLAPFGVGTVDQALMAVLQTRHYFVRLAGLAGKVVVIDEVHAYDAYMSEILDHLLRWLASLGCSVVLLSATLPARRRRELLQAFAAGLNGENGKARHSQVPALPDLTEDATYPRIAWNSGNGSGSLPITSTSTRTVRIHWVANLDDESTEAGTTLGQELIEALSGGGCAAVICNTVGTAQSVYRSLQKHFGPDELGLFHARYVFSERDRREKETIHRFGKPEEGFLVNKVRPKRFVLVATQVIEQSLDIDFDLIVSVIAPSDLVLQRTGRLQRHNLTRPSKLANPTLWLVRPKVDPDGVPHFGQGDEWVYEPHLLLRTWLSLQGKDSIRIPEDIENLVEAVYDQRSCPADLPEAVRHYWDETAEALEKKRSYLRKRAHEVLIPGPDSESDYLTYRNAFLEEDNPDVAPVFQALTRLTEPTAPVVLERSQDARVPNPQTTPDAAETLRLLGRSVSLSHGGVVPLLLKDQSLTPPGWAKSPLLRHHRRLILDSNNTTRIGGWEIEENPDLGIVIRLGKEEERA